MIRMMVILIFKIMNRLAEGKVLDNVENNNNTESFQGHFGDTREFKVIFDIFPSHMFYFFRLFWEEL